MICNKCGTENPDNAKFCAVCGNPMNAESAMGDSPNSQAAYDQSMFGDTEVLSENFRGNAPGGFRPDGPAPQQPQQPQYPVPVQPQTPAQPQQYGFQPQQYGTQTMTAPAPKKGPAKLIIIIAIAVVAVAGIVVGIIFGLKGCSGGATGSYKDAVTGPGKHVQQRQVYRSDGKVLGRGQGSRHGRHGIIPLPAQRR